MLMAVIKNTKNNTWEVRTYYMDWTGERKQKTKRGFAKKSEAQEWERSFKLKCDQNLDMKFEDFVEVYLNDIQLRLKRNSFLTKEHIIRTKILPYFKKKKLQDIRPSDIIQWQNEIMKKTKDNGEAFSPVYLKTIHNQMSAILNHAVNLYGLNANVARKAGGMGKEKSREVEFWTQGDYQKFIEEVADKEISFYAFEMLYWTGIREGELLALTKSDFDFKKGTLTIDKSYQRLEGEDIITTPKTEKSNRTIIMPDFLCIEMKEYIKSLYGYRKHDRIFQISKSYLHHEMDRGAAAAGIRRIKIHGLRHSHISLLIHLGYSPLAIGERVGHEAVDITYRYAHLFPTVQSDMANKLNQEREELINVGEEHGQEKPLEKRNGSIQDVKGRKRGTGNESETDGF
jgi:integrase